MDPQLVGRDVEIAEISALLSTPSGKPTAMAITGDPGIGKTMVLRHIARAASRSSRVLSCQPASAERPLAFAALDDLFGEVAAEVLPALPGPRRQAVEVALLRDVSRSLPRARRTGTDRAPPGRRVLARAVLDMLQILSRDSPLVLAADDAHWLDRPTAAVLEFCFRRLRHEPVSILLASRTNGVFPFGLDRALPPDRLGHVHLGPLSLGAIGEILRTRLDIALPRHTLTRLYEACGGNPFYALECARTLPHLRVPPTNEPLPLPKSLTHLVRSRVRRLSPEVWRVGLLVAASSYPRERLIRAACSDQESWAAIDQAIDEGLLERDGETLRFTHPLLRSALYADMTLHERRSLHQRLGAAAEDVEERAWHVALGADRPSEEIARMLDGAARHAESRGAPEAAAALEEQATRLTPARRPDAAHDRVVNAADYHFRAGDIARSRELIQAALTAFPAGPMRAPLLVRLATIHYHQSGWPSAEQTFRQAALEAPDDPALRAHAEQELAFARLVAGDLPAASRWAWESLRSAERAGDPHLIAHSLARIALFEFLRGHGVQFDLLERAEALDSSAGEEALGRLAMLDPSLVAGMVLKWCDRLDDARPKLANRYRLAIARGDEASLPFLLYHFSQLEFWAGDWDLAEEYALEGCRLAQETHQEPMRPATLYSLALVRAHQGRVREARELVNQVLALCESTGNVPVTSLAVAILGFIALSLDDYQAAHFHLGSLAEATAGLGEPGVVKFLPDEIEALIALGETDLACSYTQKLEEQGKSLGRPWALAAGTRCRAQLAAADGDFQEARSACEQALLFHEDLPMPFELARTLLVKGMIERRARHKSAARSSLAQAAATFERLGARLWAAKARRELARITTRASGDSLTPAEHRIADLITQGQTNRQVAVALFITENTVQTHIRHIFQKLGVRSRTELVAKLLSAPARTMAAEHSAPDSKPR